MSCKIPSENMKKMYAARRTASLNKVQMAIDKIKGEGRIVTKKELVELTGLSSSAFSQPHFKALLRENQVCQFAPTKQEKLKHTQKTLQDLEYRNKQLEKQLNTLTKQCQMLSQQYNEMLAMIQSLTANNSTTTSHVSFANR